MAATILGSPRAVEVSVYVVRAFVQLRELVATHQGLAKRLDALEARLEEKTESPAMQHDTFSRNTLAPPQQFARRSWVVHVHDVLMPGSASSF